MMRHRWVLFLMVCAVSMVSVAQGEFVAEFSYEVTEPMTIEFISQAEGDITQYYWDFGDGWHSSERNPVHTYEVAGTYTVVFGVANYSGGAFRTHQVTVGDSDASTQDNDVRFGMNLAGQPYVGERDAEVVIVEFIDYSCPHCQRFHEDTYSLIIDTYGPHVRFVFRNFPVLGEQSMLAGVASECAYQQDRFLDYHNALFFHGGSSFNEAFFVTLADSLELDMEVFMTCFEEQETLSEVQADYEAGLAVEAQGTPAFLINGELVRGAQSFEFFADIIDRILDAGGA